MTKESKVSTLVCCPVEIEMGLGAGERERERERQRQTTTQRTKKQKKKWKNKKIWPGSIKKKEMEWTCYDILSVCVLVVSDLMGLACILA